MRKSLTQRQIEVIEAVIQHRGLKRAARNLGIEARTVESHMNVARAFCNEPTTIGVCIAHYLATRPCREGQ